MVDTYYLLPLIYKVYLHKIKVWKMQFLFKRVSLLLLLTWRILFLSFCSLKSNFRVIWDKLSLSNFENNRFLPYMWKYTPCLAYSWCSTELMFPPPPPISRGLWERTSSSHHFCILPNLAIPSLPQNIKYLPLFLLKGHQVLEVQRRLSPCSKKMTFWGEKHANLGQTVSLTLTCLGLILCIQQSSQLAGFPSAFFSYTSFKL